MPEPVSLLLRRSLLAKYRELVARLTRRLGSSDLASEALHETWLRLERAGNLSEVANPEAYLYRAALNTATNIQVAEGRRLTAVEVDELLDLPDDAPGPERIVEGRVEFARLEQAIAELPPRQRAVFRDHLLHEVPHDVLAKRYGVTARTIRNDVRHAIEHCMARLGKDAFFSFARRQLSRE